MVSILIIFFCFSNFKKAIFRGKNGLTAVFYTLAIIFCINQIGNILFVSLYNRSYGHDPGNEMLKLLSFLMAMLGGGISRIIANKGVGITKNENIKKDYIFKNNDDIEDAEIVDKDDNKK
jgi:hypothetical protein